MENLSRKLRNYSIGAITGLSSFLFGVGCPVQPVSTTPTLPHDFFEGETRALYEEDLKVGYDNREPYNLIHGFPALQVLAHPVILPSLDGDTVGDLGGLAQLLNDAILTNNNLPALPLAPFKVSFVPKGQNDVPNIPFIYTEMDLLFEDTNVDHFATGSSFTVWIPKANNFIVDPTHFVKVKWYPGAHSERYTFEHPTPGPQGPQGPAGPPGGTIPECTTKTLEQTLAGINTQFIDSALNTPYSTITNWGANNTLNLTVRHSQHPELDCYARNPPVLQLAETGNNTNVYVDQNSFNPPRLDTSNGTNGEVIHTAPMQDLGVVNGVRVFETTLSLKYTNPNSPTTPTNETLNARVDVPLRNGSLIPAVNDDLIIIP